MGEEGKGENPYACRICAPACARLERAFDESGHPGVTGIVGNLQKMRDKWIIKARL